MLEPHLTHSEPEELTEQVILALSSAVEAKDRYTRGHSQRVTRYARAIARRMGWDAARCRQVYYAGLLHDVGKLRVPDAIINKPSGLTDAEFEEAKLHTLVGYYMLKGISATSDFAVTARWHHERYDGSGYPNGLSGENIPLIARIVCVADAYDAMTSTRSYRGALPHARVREEIAAGLGTHFDPVLGQIMLDIIDEDTDYRLRETPPPSHYSILAVDDDPMVLHLLSFLLSQEPRYRVATAASGDEALRTLREQGADLVLLDVEMPGRNGFDVLARIRADFGRTRVIFMTGEKDMGIIQKAEAMGVSDYLTKPVVPHILHESVRNVLLSVPAIHF